MPNIRQIAIGFSVLLVCAGMLTTAIAQQPIPASTARYPLHLFQDDHLPEIRAQDVQGLPEIYAENVQAKRQLSPQEKASQASRLPASENKQFYDPTDSKIIYMNLPSENCQPTAGDGCQCGNRNCRKGNSMHSVYWPRPQSAKLDDHFPVHASQRYSPYPKRSFTDVFDRFENFRLTNYTRGDNGYCGEDADPFGSPGESRVAGVAFRQPGAPAAVPWSSKAIQKAIQYWPGARALQLSSGPR